VQNYFELFDIPISFVINLDELGMRYRQLQQRIHPDKFVTSSAQERRLSIQYAARVNDAYQALKKPLPRAQYLLELQQQLINETDVADGVLENSFLMQQMELRETLEGITATQNPQETLDGFIKQIDQLENNYIETLIVQFETITKENLSQASETIKKLQFITKLKEETIELEDELQ